jgi:hypothetical protein
VVSQTPLAHTEVPTAAVQTPVSAGECPVSVGIAEPFESCATHVGAGLAPVLHHSVDVQSPSTTHAVPQAPPASQTAPACVAPAAPHVVVPPAVPHVVQAPPFPGQ